MRQLKHALITQIRERLHAGLILLPAVFGSLLISGMAHADISNCNITVSPTEHSYGEILKGRQNFSSTAQGNAATLSSRTSNLSVTCPQPERLDLRFSGLSHSDGTFSFGAKGKVDVSISSAVLDGNSVQMAKTKHKGTMIGPVVSDAQTLSADDEITIGTNSSVKGSNFTAVITITPHLLESAFVVQDAWLQEELIAIELLAVN